MGNDWCAVDRRDVKIETMSDRRNGKLKRTTGTTDQLEEIFFEKIGRRDLMLADQVLIRITQWISTHHTQSVGPTGDFDHM